MQIPPQNELYYGIGEKSEWEISTAHLLFSEFINSFIRINVIHVRILNKFLATSGKVFTPKKFF